MDIGGKVAVVTGAASGIGRATARALATEGASVIAADVDRAGLDETVGLIAENGGAATPVEADVSKPVDIRAMIEAAERTYGGVDILHNHAGIVSGGTPPWPGTSLERIAEVVNVNLVGIIMGTRAALDAMPKRGGGVVVNTGSGVALGPFPQDPVYVASKSGVFLFTQSCAPLKQTHNVRVAGVLITGFVDTPVWGKFGDGTTPPDWLKAVLATAPLLPPATVAKAVIEIIRDDTVCGEMRMVPAL